MNITATMIDNQIAKQCQMTFGRQFDSNICSTLLLALYYKSTDNRTHDNNNDCEQYYTPDSYERSNCVQFEQSIYRLLMPPMMICCLVGNVLNLLIYRRAYFDGSSAVHFLQGKAIANLLFVYSRLFEMLNAYVTHYSIVEFKIAYWHTRAHMMTLVSVSSNRSDCMSYTFAGEHIGNDIDMVTFDSFSFYIITFRFTLVVAVETTAAVIRPFNFRQYCTRPATNVLLVALLLLSIGIHILYPLAHTIDTRETRLYAPNHSCYTLVTLSMRLENGQFYTMYEKVYYWLQAAV